MSLVRSKSKIKSGCFAIQISGLRYNQSQIDEIKREMPELSDSEIQLSIRLNDMQILLKKEKE
jgi:hypothetical protein